MSLSPFFIGFEPIDIVVNGVKFAGVAGGEGPPLLLLHGYPETHIAWRRVAPTLAARYRVIIPDLPGYGASVIPDDGVRWGKRRVGEALDRLMRHLGHDRYAIVGHDRGARVGYRMALDRPSTVSAFASVAVVPTVDAMEAIDYRSAKARFHWFFLAQPEPLPEHLLAADPHLFLSRTLDGMTDGRPFLEIAARDAYHAAFGREEVRHAMCEDYRAALAEDLEADRNDRASARRLACPVLALWPEADHLNDPASPVEIWRRWADDVTGMGLSGGHLLPEESAMPLLEVLLPFLDRAAR